MRGLRASGIQAVLSWGERLGRAGRETPIMTAKCTYTQKTWGREEASRRKQGGVLLLLGAVAIQEG